MRPFSTACLLLPLAACGGTAFPAGPDGLHIDFPFGGGLDIPEGALAEEVDIGVELLTDLGGWSSVDVEGAGVPTTAISLTPHGLIFETPATLSLPAPDWVDGMVVLEADSPGDASWEGMRGISHDGDLATLAIDHFSAYQLTVIKDGSCPCWDADDVVSFFKEGNRRVKEEGWTELAWGGGTNFGQEFREDESSYFALHVSANRNRRTCEVIDRAGAQDTFLPRWNSELGNSGLTATQHGACNALLRAGMSGTLGVGTLVQVIGLPDGGTLTLADAAGNETIVDSDGAPGPIVKLGEPYAITLTDSPAGLDCILENGEGTAPTDSDEHVELRVVCTSPPTDADGDKVPATDDCDDTDAAVHPGAQELCDGKDTDCDGTFSESETIDQDGDGLMDWCDGNESLGCDCFNASQVAEVNALAGAECYDQVQYGDAVVWGVYADLGGGAYERALVSLEVTDGGSRIECEYGCTPEDDPACGGRPAEVITSLVSAMQFASCQDLIEATCPP